MADHTLLDPSWFAYDTPGLWNNYTHNGLLYLYTPGRGTEKPVDPDDPGQKAGSGGGRL